MNFFSLRKLIHKERVHNPGIKNVLNVQYANALPKGEGKCINF